MADVMFHLLCFSFCLCIKKLLILNNRAETFARKSCCLCLYLFIKCEYGRIQFLY